MKRSAFATLCGVSKQMISKYGAFLVMDGDEVDAAASLEALEGRLDEAKRQSALEALGGASIMAATSPSPRGDRVVPTSAKAQKDEVELALKQLQLGREAGELVSAEAVDAAARDAVARMREAFGNRRRTLAEAVCAQFGVPADKAAPLARLLAREFEGVLGVFAEEMAGLVTTPATQPAPQEPAAAAAL